MDEIFGITRIDRWFLAKLKKMADFEKALEKDGLTVEHYEAGKKMGYPDDTLMRLSGAAALPCRTERRRLQDGGHLRRGVRRRDALFLFHL